MIRYGAPRPMAVPRTLETRIEIMKAIQSLFSQTGTEKYDPNRPRVPAGDSNGGQWTSSAASDVSHIVARAKSLNLAAGPGGYQRCLDLCYPLLERFLRPGSDLNTWDFHKCMNACLGR